MPDVRLNEYTRLPAPSCDCVTIHPAMGGELLIPPLGGRASAGRAGGIIPEHLSTTRSFNEVWSFRANDSLRGNPSAFAKCYGATSGYVWLCQTTFYLSGCSRFVQHDTTLWAVLSNKSLKN